MAEAGAASVDGSRSDNLAEVVAGRQWYHTLDLAPGVVTPGYFDHRPIADLVLPASCAGMRCLDLGSFDGFWAFEMERRGASEVVAVDILDDRRWDWPASVSSAAIEGIAERKGAGEGFVIAREHLGSEVERLDLSIYDLDPDVHGTFDLVFLGSLLHHLRDPVGALERARSVCGRWFAAIDAVSIALDLVPLAVADLDGRGRPCWWKPNVRALARMVEAAGFELVSGPHRFLLPPGAGMPDPPLTAGLFASREGRELALTKVLGAVVHARLLARPAGVA